MMSETIDIVFNGDAVAVQQGVSVDDFLQQAEITAGRFVVVVNDEIVPKSQYVNSMLNSGDVFDILSPISGG